MTDPTTQHQPGGLLISPPAKADERSHRLWTMTPDERIAAMHAGELTMSQCLEWARRAPEEVPRIGHEFWFIAALTPEVADADD